MSVQQIQKFIEPTNYIILLGRIQPPIDQQCLQTVRLSALEIINQGIPDMENAFCPYGETPTGFSEDSGIRLGASYLSR
jgi:hypothetical protein